MKTQTEIPVHNNEFTTNRSLCKKHPSNTSILNYNEEKQYKELLDEVKIRFDTNPKYYQREDYQKLIELFKYNGGGGEGDWLTEDDLKTINNESIVGEGSIEIHDCELSVDYTFELADGKYIYTEGDYNEETETITPLRATYDEQTQIITLL